MNKTAISWTDMSWNPCRGCSRVSEGCRHCYAELMAARFSEPGLWGHGFAEMTQHGPRWTGRVEPIPSKLDEPLRLRKPQRIFVNSTSDLFHEALPFKDIAAVYNVMAAADRHQFQVLTKRPERRLEFFRWLSDEMSWPHLGDALRVSMEVEWPLPNVWEGTSIEDQKTADERIPLLLQTPAAVRFVSYEPALGPVVFDEEWLSGENVGESRYACDEETSVGYPESCRNFPGCVGCEPRPTGPFVPGLDLVIVGGESGRGARPCDIEWIRSVADQCREAGVPVWVKQDNGPRPGMQGRIPDDLWALKELPR